MTGSGTSLTGNRTSELPALGASEVRPGRRRTAPRSAFLLLLFEKRGAKPKHPTRFGPSNPPGPRPLLPALSRSGVSRAARRRAADGGSRADEAGERGGGAAGAGQGMADAPSACAYVRERAEGGSLPGPAALPFVFPRKRAPPSSRRPHLLPGAPPSTPTCLLRPPLPSRGPQPEEQFQSWGWRSTGPALRRRDHAGQSVSRQK